MTKHNQPFVIAGGGTASGNAAWISTPTDYAMICSIQVVVTGSPTAAASFVVFYRVDGVNVQTLGATIFVPTVAGSYYWTIEVPDAAAEVNVGYVAQTGGTSTLTANLASLQG